MIRARREIEGEIACLAAQNARRKDLKPIRDAIDAMKDDAARNVAPLVGDRAFHLAVAAACGNGVLLETVQTYWDARHGPLFERLGDHFENVASWRIAIAEHEQVLGAIEAKDPDAARAAMQHHMDRSHARFSASWRRANSA